MRARRVPKLDPPRTLAENAARIARVRLDELRGFADEALDPDGSKAQHNMRIAAKRLRYLLEITGFCLGSPAERARKSSRTLQDLLGSIHDCDVMLPRVAEHAEHLRTEDIAAIRARAGNTDDLDVAAMAAATNRGCYRGLETLALHLRSRRELLFERFRDFWAREERRGTWKNLDRAAREVLNAEREKRKARAAVPDPVDEPVGRRAEDTDGAQPSPAPAPPQPAFPAS